MQKFLLKRRGKFFYGSLYLNLLLRFFKMSKNKYEKYEDKANEIIIIGIEFSKKDRNICKFEWERVK